MFSFNYLNSATLLGFVWARLTLEAAAAHNQTSGRSPPPLVLLPRPLSRVAVDGLLLGLLLAFSLA